MTTTNDYPVWRQRLSFILDFLIVFELIINTHSVYYFALDRDYYTLYVLTGLICLQLVVLPTVFAWEHLKKLLPVAVAWSAYIIIYAVVSGGDIKRLLAKFIILLVILFVYFYGHMVRGTIKQLFKHYIDVVFVIALISIFMWLTCSVLKWFPATSPFRIEWGADRRIWSFYGIYFHWQNDFFIHGMRFYRNIGIFTEAPMFSLHLCTALMFDLMINDHHTKFRWFRILWFCGTILTTFSITGYLFMMVLIVINLYATLIVRARSEDEATAKKAKKQLVLVTVLGLALAAVGFSLIADKLASRSGGSRTEDFRNGYKGWRDHVWFGAGFGDIEARLQYASWRRQHRSNTGFTNSPMAILCEGGIWFFMGYYLSFVYGLFASLHKRDWRAFICLCLMVFLFVTTTMEHTAYIISFIAFMIMKRVITYGTFDLLHYGHINMLKRCKEQGDYLIVAVSTDEFNWNMKQKKSYFTYEQRKTLVEAIRYVDLVIPEETWEQKKTDVHEYHIDTFVIGDDWEGKFDFLKDEGVEVVYLPRTPEISTTQIKQDLYGEEKD